MEVTTVGADSGDDDLNSTWRCSTTMERSTMLSMGKSTMNGQFLMETSSTMLFFGQFAISTGPFSIATC